MGKVGYTCNDGLRNTHPIPHPVNRWNCHFGMDHVSKKAAPVGAVYISGETNVKQDDSILILLEY